MRFPQLIKLPGQTTLLLLLGCLSPSLQADEFFQLGVTAGQEDNVPRILNRNSESESGFVTVDFSGGESFQLGLNQTITLSADLAATRYVERKGFGRLSATAAASYSYKFGLGAYAPRLTALLSYGAEQWDGEARDNRVFTTGVNFEKRLSPTWLVVFGLDYQSSDGDSLPGDQRLTDIGYTRAAGVPYDLYDYDSHSAFAEVQYEMANGFLLSAGYNRSDGYTIAASELPNAHVYQASKAVYIDPAWPDLWYAYRLKTDSDEGTLGLSMPVTRDAAIDLRASWQDIDGPGNRDYKNRIISVGFIQSF